MKNRKSSTSKIILNQIIYKQKQINKMKRIIRKVALAMVFALCGGVFVANAQKLGYVDLQEVMVAMPEYKKANTDMEKYQKQLDED